MSDNQLPTGRPPAELPLSPVQPDAWHALRRLTPARIALGRSGSSSPTAELLDFQLAHARARDAVHAPFDPAGLAAELIGHGWASPKCMASAAGEDRALYLQRPDLGRQLAVGSADLIRRFVNLDGWPPEARDLVPSDNADSVEFVAKADLAIVVSDGLSALAAHRQVPPLLAAWLPLIRADRWRLAPVVIVAGGRVAIEDEIGQLLGARVAVILIGERPGLGSPDSLGAYLVYDPRPGRTDADRNCISNIRPQGLPIDAAALKLHYLVREALARRLSGVALKDESVLTAAEQTQIAQKPPDALTDR